MRKRIVFSVAALIAVLATPGCKESPTTPPEFEPGAAGCSHFGGRRGRADTHAAFGHGRAVAGGPCPGTGPSSPSEDMGPVHGRQVDLGDPVDTSCSPEGGREGALGIIGTRRWPASSEQLLGPRPWRRRPSSATRAWS